MHVNLSVLLILCNLKRKCLLVADTYEGVDDVLSYKCHVSELVSDKEFQHFSPQNSLQTNPYSALYRVNSYK